MALVQGILSSALGQTVLVFILLFVLVFAILQKTKLLGDGKSKIDALIAFAIGLIGVSVGYSLDIITKIIPVLAVGLVVILVFLLLIGIFYEKEFIAPNWMKNTAMILALLLVIITVLYITGSFGYIADFFSGDNSGLIGNIVIIAVAVIAVLAVLLGNKST